MATADSTGPQRRPSHISCPSTSAPGLCLHDPAHRVASHARLLDMYPFRRRRLVCRRFLFKNCFHTWVPLYRYTSSHIRLQMQNRCAKDRKAERNRPPEIRPAVGEECTTTGKGVRNPADKLNKLENDILGERRACVWRV